MKKVMFAIIFVLSANTSVWSTDLENYKLPATFKKEQCLVFTMALTYKHTERLKTTHNYSSETDPDFFGFVWGGYNAECQIMFEYTDLQHLAGNTEILEDYIEGSIAVKLTALRTAFKNMRDLMGKAKRAK